ncbi:vacuolar-type H+-ATPase subunit E/Vma4 [Lacrimispora xylanisolvens]|uniref:Vacuolar-type H+-ATPase subunit E/Vma4 n=1 Tax=Lacrimispora xylanisolvens TaxID=384636 RepID=A0A2S6HFY5_9FIRM|nr:V-type ATP synthase subunit E [Hungatella xylanolytica]MBE5990322.1 ATPase [Paenibacillaceae bacterium]PPK76387.1 vacuolar-type H+-ATPase subunit E/Vma4 [Hungatella xylanolytica]
MTTEEKLQHFLEFCMEDARSRSAKMLDEYTAALEQTFSEHQEDAKRRARQQVASESEQIEREINKRLSLEQIGTKREFGKKQDELKEKLFQELQEMVNHFRNTPQYTELIEKEIREAKELAGKEFITIYIDPADEEKIRSLSLPESADIRVSEYSFMGGTRAVIPNRHILIDNSFQTKLAEAKRDFRFNIKDLMGGTEND